MNREDITAIYNSGSEAVIKLVDTLVSQIEELQNRIKSLEEQLSKDSHNSSKPPSSDGFKKVIKSSHSKSQLKVGGQKGHKGYTLRQIDDPDFTVIHNIHTCTDCGCSLDEIDAKTYERRQVFDIPEPKMEVTEHRAEIKKCPHCGKINKAEFPSDVTQPVQYGNRIKSQAVYLMNQHLIPYERTGEILKDFHGYQLSPGTIFNANQTCYKNLEGTEQNIKKRIIFSPVVNFDESGIQIGNGLKWFHSASTKELTYYSYHDKRGNAAMVDIGILPEFTGIAVHDHWKSYFQFDCSHALCNAHHLRELTFIVEQRNQEWAQKMIDLLKGINYTVSQVKSENIDHLELDVIKKFEQKYQEILKEGFVINPLPEAPIKPRKGRIKKSKARNLLERLRDYQKETLAFMHDFRVPFDNNLAERDIRMVKVQQKISGCFRSDLGAKFFCRIRGYISTTKKQNQNVLNVIQRALSQQPINLCKAE